MLPYFDKTFSAKEGQIVKYLDVFAKDSTRYVAILLQQEKSFELVFCDLNTQNCETPVPLPHFKEIYQIMWSPDGQNIAISATLNEDVEVNVPVSTDMPISFEASCPRGCLFILDKVSKNINWIQDVKNGIQHFWWGVP